MQKYVEQGISWRATKNNSILALSSIVKMKEVPSAFVVKLAILETFAKFVKDL